MRRAKRPAKLQEQKGKKAEMGKSVVCVSNSKKAGVASWGKNCGNQDRRYYESQF